MLRQERLAVATSGGRFHEDTDGGVGTDSNLIPKDARLSKELADRQATPPRRNFQVLFLLGTHRSRE